MHISTAMVVDNLVEEEESESDSMTEVDTDLSSTVPSSQMFSITRDQYQNRKTETDQELKVPSNQELRRPFFEDRKKLEYESDLKDPMEELHVFRKTSV